MGRKYNLMLPIFVLVMTTLALGGIVYGLLWREAQRIERIGASAAIEQARTVAENIALTIAETKTALMDGLSSFSGPAFGPQLDEWQRQEPLAAFTFRWSSDAPNDIEVYSTEDYDRSVVSHKGVWLWDQPEPVLRDAAEAEESAPAATAAQSSPFSNYADVAETRQQIRKQSQISSQRALEKYEPARSWTVSSTEWIQKRVNGSLFWVGIAKWNDSDVITGVGFNPLSMGASLSRSLPSEYSSSVAKFVLLDPSGKDALNLDPAAKLFSSQRKQSYSIERSDTLIPIGPELPAWNLLLALDSAGTLQGLLTSSASIATFTILLALFASGLWLAWQSRASQRDAAQRVSFVSNVSHELKTPLTSIRMYSELLNSERVDDPDKRHQYLNTITMESQRLARMVNNVLDFSRLESGKAQIEASAHPLSATVNDYLEMRREDIEKAGFKFVSHIEESDYLYQFEPDALTQIIGNLIDNSLKYAQDGKWISVHSIESEDEATIVVADRGPGLPKGLRKRRFKAFEQGDSSLVKESKGFGLGLSIAQALAEEMGAQLEYVHPKRRIETPRFVLRLKASR